jgi:hypothetical protein
MENAPINFFKFEHGEEVLAAAELFGSLIIYTNSSIWRMKISPFIVEKIYSDPKVSAAGFEPAPSSTVGEHPTTAVRKLDSE